MQLHQYQIAAHEQACHMMVPDTLLVVITTIILSSTFLPKLALHVLEQFLQQSRHK